MLTERDLPEAVFGTVLPPGKSQKLNDNKREAREDDGAKKFYFWIFKKR